VRAKILLTQEQVVDALQRGGGDVEVAAKILWVSRRTLYRWLSEHPSAHPPHRTKHAGRAIQRPYRVTWQHRKPRTEVWVSRGAAKDAIAERGCRLRSDNKIVNAEHRIVGRGRDVHRSG